MFRRKPDPERVNRIVPIQRDDTRCAVRSVWSFHSDAGQRQEGSERVEMVGNANDS